MTTNIILGQVAATEVAATTMGLWTTIAICLLLGVVSYFAVFFLCRFFYKPKQEKVVQEINEDNSDLLNQIDELQRCCDELRKSSADLEMYQDIIISLRDNFPELSPNCSYEENNKALIRFIQERFADIRGFRINQQNFNTFVEHSTRAAKSYTTMEQLGRVVKDLNRQLASNKPPISQNYSDQIFKQFIDAANKCFDEIREFDKDNR